MFWRVLKITVSRFYDHLGKCVGINLLWFLVSLTVVVLPPATAALFWHTNETVRFEDPDTRGFFRAMRRFFFRSWGLFLAQAAIMVGLAWGMLIYIEELSQVIGRVALVLAAVCLWMFVFFSGILGYMWVFLVYQDAGIWTAAKRAAALFFLRPLLTLGLLAVTAALFALDWFFIALPLVFFQMALLAIMCNVAVLAALDELPE